MPIYEYGCQSCSHVFEEWQRNHDDCDVACPVCGEKTQRLISNTSFVLKGSGWYVTDYPKEKKNEGTGTTAKATAGKESAADKSADTGSADKSTTASASAEPAPPKAAASTSATTAV